ncbi:hypothetical protein LZV00_11120 [Pseudomonas kielensis]|uniref:hypothetical protein n=1 Tax=Pseudomonas kielensis TaxID=2762577 RepID=UPI0022407236|nr:hypothetical protein [Pseudomonas kielensis]UZM16216.1 hypothetical protein LZV00_11120 [Pseudomonas kielensis]
MTAGAAIYNSSVESKEKTFSAVYQRVAEGRKSEKIKMSSRTTMVFDGITELPIAAGVRGANKVWQQARTERGVIIRMGTEGMTHSDMPADQPGPGLNNVPGDENDVSEPHKEVSGSRTKRSLEDRGSTPMPANVQEAAGAQTTPRLGGATPAPLTQAPEGPDALALAGPSTGRPKRQAAIGSHATPIASLNNTLSSESTSQTYLAGDNASNIVINAKDRLLDELAERHHIPMDRRLNKDSEITLKIEAANMLGFSVGDTPAYFKISLDELISKNQCLDELIAEKKHEWAPVDSDFSFPIYSIDWPEEYPSGFTLELGTAAFRDQYFSKIEKLNYEQLVDLRSRLNQINAKIQNHALMTQYKQKATMNISELPTSFDKNNTPVHLIDERNDLETQIMIKKRKLETEISEKNTGSGVVKNELSDAENIISPPPIDNAEYSRLKDSVKDKLDRWIVEVANSKGLVITTQDLDQLITVRHPIGAMGHGGLSFGNNQDSHFTLREILLGEADRGVFIRMGSGNTLNIIGIKTDSGYRGGSVIDFLKKPETIDSALLMV